MINELIIAFLGVNDFVVALATLSIAAGLLQVLTSNVQLTGASKDSAYVSLSSGHLPAIPTPVVILVVVAAVLEFVLVCTPFGRSVLAAAVGPRAAALAGVPVRRIRLQVYVLSGAAAGLGGVLLAAQLNSVQPGLGAGYELNAIAAAVLGGIALSGGRGSVCRAVLGASFLGLLANELQAYRQVIGSNRIVVSFATVTELRYGALRAGRGELRRRDLERDLARFVTAQPDDQLMRVCAQLRASRERAGHPLGHKIHEADWWIAATALRLDIELVSDDQAFRGVPGLRVRTVACGRPRQPLAAHAWPAVVDHQQGHRPQRGGGAGGQRNRTRSPPRRSSSRSAAG